MLLPALLSRSSSSRSHPSSCPSGCANTLALPTTARRWCSGARSSRWVGGSGVPGKVAALATWLGEARLRRWRGGAAVKRRRMQLASTAAAHHPPRPPGPTLVLVEKRRLEKARSMRTGSHAPTADADQHSTSLTSLPGGEAAAGEGAQEVDGGAAAAAARAGGQGEGGGAPWLGCLVFLWLNWVVGFLAASPLVKLARAGGQGGPASLPLPPCHCRAQTSHGVVSGPSLSLPQHAEQGLRQHC